MSVHADHNGPEIPARALEGVLKILLGFSFRDESSIYSWRGNPHELVCGLTAQPEGPVSNAPSSLRAPNRQVDHRPVHKRYIDTGSTSFTGAN
jgi:hypothetical protein